nr:unnamed protein product [uncultured bacterium]
MTQNQPPINAVQRNNNAAGSRDNARENGTTVPGPGPSNSNPYSDGNPYNPDNYSGQMFKGNSGAKRRWDLTKAALEWEAQQRAIADERSYQEAIYEKYNSPQALALQNRAAGLNPDLQGVQGGFDASNAGSSAVNSTFGTAPSSIGSNAADVSLGVLSSLPGIVGSAFGVAKQVADTKHQELINDSQAIQNAKDIMDFSNNARYSYGYKDFKVPLSRKGEKMYKSARLDRTSPFDDFVFNKSRTEYNDAEIDLDMSLEEIFKRGLGTDFENITIGNSVYSPNPDSPRGKFVAHVKEMAKMEMELDELLAEVQKGNAELAKDYIPLQKRLKGIEERYARMREEDLDFAFDFDKEDFNLWDFVKMLFYNTNGGSGASAVFDKLVSLYNLTKGRPGKGGSRSTD